MKAKIENNKLVIIPESAGEKLALEIWRLGEASIILEAYNAQQSMHPTSGTLLGLGELSKLEENPAPKILLTPPTCG